jgi:hypothetical protein
MCLDQSPDGLDGRGQNADLTDNNEANALSAFLDEEERMCGPQERLREGLAILKAIEAGDLLAATPPNPADRERHQAAVLLLAVLEQVLQNALGGCER